MPYQCNLCGDVGITDIKAHKCGPMRNQEPRDAPETVRGETHGDYTRMSTRIQRIKDELHEGLRWDMMSVTQRESLELIATKIGRIIEGDPNHHDHWADIAGYANLAKDRIPHKKG